MNWDGAGVAGTRKSTMRGCLAFAVPIVITWVLFIWFEWYMCRCYDDSGNNDNARCLRLSAPAQFMSDGEGSCSSGEVYGGEGTKADLATCIARRECLHDNTVRPTRGQAPRPPSHLMSSFTLNY